MKIFENFNKFFGRIGAKDVGNQIKITGIDGEVLRKLFKEVLATDTPSKLMFSEVTDTSLKFNSFFLPDIVYLLTKARHHPNCKWSMGKTIDKMMKEILTNTWFKCSIANDIKPIIDPDRQKLLKWTALPKQLEFLHLYGDRIPRYDLRGYIVALAPGLGKTFTDLLVTTCVVPPSVAECKIIISPKKAVHLVWEDTITKVFKKMPTYWVVGNGAKEPPVHNCEYYVFNYEQLPQAVELAKKLQTAGKRYFVIVDESHNFADYKSNRTQMLVQLQSMPAQSYFIWTSGTPILKNAAELIAFLKCADPRFDADAEQRFKRIYSNAPGKANEIFNHRLGLMMAFMVPKSAVTNVKPTIVELPVKLPPSVGNRFLMSTVREDMKTFMMERLEFYKARIREDRDIVDSALKDHEQTLQTRQDWKKFDEYRKALKLIMRNPDLTMMDQMSICRTYERSRLLPVMAPMKRKQFRSSLSAVKNIKLKIRGEALGTVLSKRRAECATALGLYCKPEKIMMDSLSKTLFFASSTSAVIALHKRLTALGFDARAVYADTNSLLTKNINDFTNDPSVNPVIATMQSLSEAVPVIAASTVVLLNRPFRQAMFEQVVARADRNGQKHPVTVVEVTLDTGGEPNVSSRTDEILAEVRVMIRDLMGADFAGPDPDEREYREAIDASQENEYVTEQNKKLDEV